MTIITRTPREVFNLWISALRSGKFRRTAHVLRCKTDTGRLQYCTLGVLLELARRDGGKKWVRSTTDSGGFVLEGQSKIGYIPDEFCHYLGLSQDDVEEIVEANDLENWGFKSMANFIEQDIMPKALKRVEHA